MCVCVGEWVSDNTLFVYLGIKATDQQYDAQNNNNNDNNNNKPTK